LDDLVAWLLGDEMGRDKLALLVICMLSISVLVAHLSWRLRRSGGPRLRMARGTWVGFWLVESCKLFFWVGIPLVVLARGALVREMGVPVTLVEPIDAPLSEPASSWHWIARGLAWIEVTDVQGLVRMGAGLVAGGGALVVLVAVWVWYVRAVLPSASLAIEPLPAVAWWDALRQAFLAQFLWAFYRGFALLLVPQRVQGALLGLALISAQWALDPRNWHELFSSRGYRVVLQWMLAFFTVVVSLVTNQLWFLIGMHALWVWVSGRLLAHLSRRLLERAAPSVSRPTS
jgi:hypothetical protein